MLDYNDLLTKFLENKEQEETYSLLKQHIGDVELQTVIKSLLNNLIADTIDDEPRDAEYIRRLINLVYALKVNVFQIYVSMLENGGSFRRFIKSYEFSAVLTQSIPNNEDIGKLEEIYFKKFEDEEQALWIKTVIFFTIMNFLNSDIYLDGVENPELTNTLNARQKRKIDFYEKIIKAVDEEISNQGDLFLYHNAFASIVDESIAREEYSLRESMEALIVKVLTASKVDYNCDIFNSYFDMLKRINPKIYCDAYDVAIFIKGLRNKVVDVDEDIFTVTSLEEVGRIVFNLAQKETGKDNLTVKIAVQLLRSRPLPRRTKPITDEDYYREIAAYLDINHLPMDTYKTAKDKYIEVQNKYKSLIAKIEALESECSKQILASENKTRQIKETTRKITDDQRIDEKELLIEMQRRKELKSLVDEDSFLSYSKTQLKNFFELFLNDEAGEKRLRSWVLSDIRSGYSNRGDNRCDNSDNSDSNNDNDVYDNTYNIEKHFAPYIQIINQFEKIITPSPAKTLQILKYRNKWLPFLNKIKKKHWQQSRTKLTETSSPEYQCFNSELQNHVLNLDALLDVNDGVCYLGRLRQVIPETLTMIRTNVGRSSCLKQRKRILEKALTQFESKDYDIVSNILPVQIEGLFADYLENSLLFEALKDISVYEKIYNNSAVLVRKAKIADEEDLNLGFG